MGGHMYHDHFGIQFITYFYDTEWMPEMGGVTSYVLKNEDEEVNGCGFHMGVVSILYYYYYYNPSIASIRCSSKQFPFYCL